jgi:hypothetical protein
MGENQRPRVTLGVEGLDATALGRRGGLRWTFRPHDEHSKDVLWESLLKVMSGKELGFGDPDWNGEGFGFLAAFSKEAQLIAEELRKRGVEMAP